MKTLIPNMITCGNMLSGMLSLVLAFHGHFVPASWLVFFAVFFDFMDGKMARKLGGSSSFGMELDSLADVVSFGVAPAMIIYSVYLKGFFGVTGAIVAAFFALCGALRLARFNVHHVDGSFQGLPIPAGGHFLVSFVVAGISLLLGPVRRWLFGRWLARAGLIQGNAGTRFLGPWNLAALAADAPASTVHPLALDWHDDAALDAALAGAVALHGPIVLAVVWIHGGAPAAPLAVARHVGAPGRRADYYHVLSSAAADPARPDAGRLARFAALPGLRYHEVILGFVREPAGSRWLTNAEIAAGVLAAIEAGAPRFVVGIVAPWENRP